MRGAQAISAQAVADKVRNAFERGEVHYNESIMAITIAARLSQGERREIGGGMVGGGRNLKSSF